jgi:hypothetical protein
MSDEYEDDVTENEAEDTERDLSAAAATAPVATSGGGYVASEADAVNPVERERIRKQLQADIDAFLSGGGKIQTIDSHVMADPPRKPQSNYGSQPI